MILEIIMRKFQIHADRAFNGVHALHLIEEKRKFPCKCGNKSYLLYFLETNLPILGGLELVKAIKE
jgi:DNA-binding response OmpR family regulator